MGYLEFYWNTLPLWGGLSTNEARTCEAIDTGLTQPRSLGVRGVAHDVSA